MERVDLHHPGKLSENIYPYGVVVLGSGKNARRTCRVGMMLGGGDFAEWQERRSKVHHR